SVSSWPIVGHVLASFYHDAGNYASGLRTCINEARTWPTIGQELTDAETLTEFWYQAWSVRCDSKDWPMWSWEHRQTAYVKLRAIAWGLREHLPHGQLPPSVPVWHWR